MNVSLKAGNAGDFVCMNGADMNERTDKSKDVVKKWLHHQKNQLVNGIQWKLSARQIQLKYTVNGVLQNKGTNVNLSQRIYLSAE